MQIQQALPGYMERAGNQSSSQGLNVATRTSGVPTRRSPRRFSRESCGTVTPGESTGQDFNVHPRGTCLEVETQPIRFV